MLLQLSIKYWDVAAHSALKVETALSYVSLASIAIPLLHLPAIHLLSDYMLQLLVISADRGKAIYLKCLYCIQPNYKGCAQMPAEKTERGWDGDRGHFIATVSLDIVREVTEEGDEEN